MKSVRRRAAAARRVLVVDDDAVCRQFCAEVLARAGYALRQASDVGQAVEQLESWRPDVVLFDLHLGRKSGAGLLSDLSGRQAALRGCRLLMMTADEARARSRPRGVAAVLLKPFAPDALLRAIGPSPGDPCARPEGSRPDQAAGSAGAPLTADAHRGPLLARLAAALPAELRALDRNIGLLQWPEASARLHRLAGATALAGQGPLSAACRLLQQCIARAAEPARLALAYVEVLALARDLLDSMGEGTLNARPPG